MTVWSKYCPSCSACPRGHSMLSSLKTLLLLSVLCTPTSSLCLRLYQSRLDLLCDDQMAVGVRSEGDEPAYSPVDGWGSLLQSAEYLSSSSSSSSSSSAESSREKRTSSPASNYRFMSRTKLRGQMLRNSSSSKGDRRSRLTLSLDVPTNIMNVLFDVAKAKNLRAKAAENARLLAQIGRRKWAESRDNFAPTDRQTDRQPWPVLASVTYSDYFRVMVLFLQGGGVFPLSTHITDTVRI